MKSLIVPQTGKTPAIEFNTGLGFLIISGRSLSDNPYDFFKPLIELAEEYCKTPCVRTTIQINLDYFNSSTSKCLFQLLRKFQAAITDNTSVLINWHYDEDDEDTLQIIETYQEYLNMPILKHVL
jgi:hypothetical protein